MTDPVTLAQQALDELKSRARRTPGIEAKLTINDPYDTGLFVLYEHGQYTTGIYRLMFDPDAHFRQDQYKLRYEKVRQDDDGYWLVKVYLPERRVRELLTGIWEAALKTWGEPAEINLARQPLTIEQDIAQNRWG